MEEATKLNFCDRVEVLVGDFNEGLPKDWDNKFTHIVSCEVFCHAASKPALLKECLRVLKPGGGFAFTDIMGADGADEKALKDFTDRNATTEMARPKGYQQLLRDAGFSEVCMPSAQGGNKEDMIKEGVPEGYLNNWVSSLTERVEIQRSKGVFAWGIFSARKLGPVC
ncbi:S-adenosyl-L-methionine-dependent methyltransferase [Baffinella frigidus]|nr:S-adenosyl-L-methionine-dependent methyltransferase [Cryptophyta sp. CCMP2293]